MTLTEAQARIVPTPDGEHLSPGEVFLGCDSWGQAYDMVRDLRYEGVYGRQPLSVPGIIVFASKLEP